MLASIFDFSKSLFDAKTAAILLKLVENMCLQPSKWTLKKKLEQISLKSLQFSTLELYFA